MLARIMRCPYNAFSRADFFNLHKWGSVRIRSVFVFLIATLVRAALQTMTVWKDWFDLLRSCEYRTLEMLNSGSLCVDHWDSPPIAQTLHRASMGFADHSLLGGVLPNIIKKALRLQAPSASKSKFSFQRYIAHELGEALYPDSISVLVRRRFRVLQPSIPWASIDFNVLQTFMRDLSPAWSTSIIKTWANAWTTSSRMHEHVRLSCVFGCQRASDELSHYLVCVRFHRLLYPRLPGEEDNSSQRLILVQPTRERALALVTLFLSYNAAKHFFLGADRYCLVRLRGVVVAAQQRALSTSFDRGQRPRAPVSLESVGRP